MIYTFYTRFADRLNSEWFNQLFQDLSPFLQSKILKFRNWQDTQRSLLGYILLLKGLKYLGVTKYSLDDLKFTRYQRPFFDNYLDFNISHSGEYVICVISITNKVGVDIEELRNISIYDFKRQFSEKEWEGILAAQDSLLSFYIHWTQKEAFLKAVGMGVNFPMNRINIINFLYPITIYKLIYYHGG